MRQLTPNYKFVKCFGLWGTFDDALTWSRTIPSAKCYLSLGSIFGNDYFEPAVARLSVWAGAMSLQDRMLLGMDARENLKEVWDAFHDAEGLFERFIRNGLVHANKVLGESWYRDEDWNVAGILQENPTTHRFVITAVRDVFCELLQLRFAAGDEIDCYETFKYGPTSMRKQFEKAGFKELGNWKAPSSPICKYSLDQTAFYIFNSRTIRKTQIMKGSLTNRVDEYLLSSSTSALDSPTTNPDASYLE